jgi:hypothetical protein
MPHAIGGKLDGLPPNGLAFSCRERAGCCLQKAHDLARAAVNCNAGLGRRIEVQWIYRLHVICCFLVELGVTSTISAISAVLPISSNALTYAIGTQ